MTEQATNTHALGCVCKGDNYCPVHPVNTPGVAYVVRNLNRRMGFVDEYDDNDIKALMETERERTRD